MPTMHPYGSIMVIYTTLLASMLVAAAVRPLDDSITVFTPQLESRRERCRPEQVHLALTSSSTEMRVSWKTKGSDCSSHVHYWPEDSSLSTTTHLSSQPTTTDQKEPSTDDDIDHGLMAGPSSVTSYSSSDMCSSPARDDSYPPIYLHTLVLTNLLPGQRYFYRVAKGSKEATARLSFMAPQGSGSDGTLRFLVYGDMGDVHYADVTKSPGAGGTIKALGREVESGKTGLIWHLGDISYADGRHEVWESFMAGIEPLASAVPYMVGIGNHEFDYEKLPYKRKQDPSGGDAPYSPDWGNYGNDSGGECGVPVTTRFIMPNTSTTTTSNTPNTHTNTRITGLHIAISSQVDCSNSRGVVSDCAPKEVEDLADDISGVDRVDGNLDMNNIEGEEGHLLLLERGRRSLESNPPFWYSFTEGPVHFITISTEHSVRPGSVQYRWLERALGAVDRCATPWVVVGMHRPMYVLYPHKSNRIVADHLRASLEELFDAHNVDLVMSGHVHSYSRTCNVYNEKCVAEEKGGMVHIIIGTAGKKLSSVSTDQADWLESSVSEHGYGRVTVEGQHSLLFEFVASKDGATVLDWVKIDNGRGDRWSCRSGNNNNNNNNKNLV